MEFFIEDWDLIQDEAAIRSMGIRCSAFPKWAGASIETEILLPSFSRITMAKRYPNEKRQTLLQKYNDFAFSDPQAIWVICEVSGRDSSQVFR